MGPRNPDCHDNMVTIWYDYPDFDDHGHDNPDYWRWWWIFKQPGATRQGRGAKFQGCRNLHPSPEDHNLVGGGNEESEVDKKGEDGEVDKKGEEDEEGVTSGLTYPNGRAYLARRLELSPSLSCSPLR